MEQTMIGWSLEQVDTPALLIDLDAFERNLAVMSGMTARAGINWRPHAKGHKSPAIAHIELRAGAIGVTVAKVGEAEVMAAGGVRDILIANQVVGPIKARRLAALAGQADPIVAIDSIANARELSAAAEAIGTRPRAIVELNVGMERAGVLPGETAVRLGDAIAQLPGLRFVGVMGYEGHGMDIPDPAARVAEITRAVGSLVATAEQMRAAGLNVEIVSASGTGTFQTAIEVGGITEVQAGGGIMGDRVYRNLGVGVEPALLLMTGVTSRPAPNRIIFDAGRKTVDPGDAGPTPRGIDGIVSEQFSAEHGRYILDHDTESPRVGDRMILEVGYHDQCTHLHDRLIGVRNGVVETVWPVASRGRLQ